MSEKILLLHLSDIHFKSEFDHINTRASSIAATTYRWLPEVSGVLVILSGDIAFSGKKAEYDIATSFLLQLKKSIICEKDNLIVEFFVCPGNHDCDFELHDETRDAVLGRIRTGDGFPSKSLIATATGIQEEFFKFRDSLGVQIYSHETRLSWQTTIKLDRFTVGVRSLNVAWMSELREKQGTLSYPAEEITPYQPGEVELSITLLHHPYNWFGQSSYKKLQNTVRSESQIVFTGHEHVQNAGEISDMRTSSSVFIEGGVLYDGKNSPKSTFNAVIVDLAKGEYLAEMYAWDGEYYVTDDESEAWGSLRPLTVKNENNCKLLQQFSQTLKDPGANFAHSGKKKLELNDFFIWPELKFLDDRATVKKNVIGSYFSDVSNLNSGVFIRGDEKSGKTTLLYQYFSSYYERGYLPLYFRGSWFTKAHQSSPSKAIKFALEKQYDGVCHIAFQQAPRNKRILLLDDIDGCSLGTEALSDCLKLFFEYFDNIIITAKDSTALMDILSIDRLEVLENFSHYEIREFGHKKRFELVCKWAEIGGAHDESSAKWMSTIDKWEKDLTTAVGRQFVPAVPIFLLTLLQSIEAGRTADLQNSAFGHYYQFLITSALQEIGVEREQWAEVFNYCSHLAWFFHSSEERHISEPTFRNFTQKFSEEFTPVPYERRLRDLVKANILAQIEGEIEFKYSYLYFYFVGQYIADHLHEPQMDTVVTELCRELHLRDNANILLFSCHHTKSPLIYERIAEALDACFDSERLFDFEKDVALLNSLVNAAPSLVYNERSVRESRSNEREQQDLADDSQIESEAAESTNAGITKLFRSMEILGQFLKNHYGTTRNPTKDALIKKVLDGSLRGLFGLTNSFINHTDSLLEHIEREAEKKGESGDEKIARAKRVIFDLMGIITFAFVNKASSAVGSAYLRDNLFNVVEGRANLGYELIAMSYQMDLPEPIPFQKLKSLNASVENNVFSRALLRSLALKHLHLFKVNYQDKQKLCEELDISLNKQFALQHNRTRSRRK